MLKFREIGTYKNAVNVPYCTSAVALKNGMIVTANLVAKTAALTTASTTKGDVYIVMNVIDKPETLKPNDYTIEIGEYPRLFRAKSLAGRIIDVDTNQVTTTYSDIDVGDYMAGDTDGKLAVVEDVSDYETYFEVIDKTTYGGAGLGLLVVDNTAGAKAYLAQVAATELPAALGTAGQVLAVNAGADGVEWKADAT